MARREVQNGVQLIDLCGAFGEAGMQAVVDAIDCDVPVGYVVYSQSEMQKHDLLFPPRRDAQTTTTSGRTKHALCGRCLSIDRLPAQRPDGIPAHLMRGRSESPSKGQQHAAVTRDGIRPGDVLTIRPAKFLPQCLSGQAIQERAQPRALVPRCDGVMIFQNVYVIRLPHLDSVRQRTEALRVMRERAVQRVLRRMIKSLFVICLVAVDLHRAVDLLQQNQARQVVRKGERRERKPDVRTRQRYIVQPQRPADEELHTRPSRFQRALQLRGKAEEIRLLPAMRRPRGRVSAFPQGAVPPFA